MKAEEFEPGVIIEVPGNGRPYCLRITSVESVSKVTGAVDLVGHVLSLRGTTARIRPLVRRVLVQPERTKKRDDLIRKEQKS